MTLSSKRAKRRVIALCEVLVAAFPGFPDSRIQDAAIDLHDLEFACDLAARLISKLRRLKPSSRKETRRALIDLDICRLDEIVSHVRTLQKFLVDAGIRDRPSVWRRAMRKKD